MRLGENGEAELTRRPQHQLVAEPGEMHHQQRARCGDLHGEVTVGNGVHAVGAERAEAELRAHTLAIQRQRRPCQRAAAQRHDVAACTRVSQALDVALQHLDVSEQMVREAHHLGALQVRVPGHGVAAVLAGSPDERLLEVGEREHELAARVLRPAAEVGGDLVVAAAPGLQLGGGRTGNLVQATLDGAVHVLVGRIERERSPTKLIAQRAQAGRDAALLGGAEHPDGMQHPRVRGRARQVLLPETAVDGNARGVLLHQRRRLGPQASVPELRRRLRHRRVAASAARRAAVQGPRERPAPASGCAAAGQRAR